MEVSGQLHVPVALPPKKEPLVLSGEKRGRFQSRSKCRGEDKNILPLPGIDPRFSVNSLFINPNLTQFGSDKVINPLEHEIHLNTIPT
jgi:hypothetical protein